MFMSLCHIYAVDVPTVSIRKEEFKYHNLIPTNTETFCDKNSHLTNYADGNYQIGNNINVVESKPYGLSL